jgi:hypothetical protein
VVFAHDRHVTRVLRAVAAAAFAVVVVGGGVEAGAGVIGIAFAGFFFGGCFFGFGFFGDEGFGFGRFRGLPFGCFGPDQGAMPPCRHLSPMATRRGPSLLSHLGTVICGAMPFSLAFDPRLLVSFSRLFATAAAAGEQQRDQDEDE